MYTKAIGVMNNVLIASLAQRHARLRFYKTLTWPIWCCESGAQQSREQDIDRITVCEM